MSAAKCFPTLQGTVVPSSSGLSNPGKVNFRLLHREDEGTAFLQNTCDYLPVDTL